MFVFDTLSIISINYLQSYLIYLLVRKTYLLSIGNPSILLQVVSLAIRQSFIDTLSRATVIRMLTSRLYGAPLVTKRAKMFRANLHTIIDNNIFGTETDLQSSFSLTTALSSSFLTMTRSLFKCHRISNSEWMENVM
jgi:hypothetical protein